MHKNTWMFKIKSMQGGTHLNTLCFYGVDSEEAHTNCIEWADKHYDQDCIAELLEGEIERNEGRRAEKVIEEMPAEIQIKKQMQSILKTRKFISVKEVNIDG